MTRVAIVHPDLGLGGAERLIVDVAEALSKRQHDVKIFTAHFNRNRCFSEVWLHHRALRQRA